MACTCDQQRKKTEMLRSAFCASLDLSAKHAMVRISHVPCHVSQGLPVKQELNALCLLETNFHFGRFEGSVILASA